MARKSKNGSSKNGNGLPAYQRIQNVIREIKERPNLILFIDEAHTMVGAGSALGAPSDRPWSGSSVWCR